MEIEQVVKELNTDLHQGLSVEEARRRLVISGYNELKSVDQNGSSWQSRGKL
jgi:magnesium-transporting ATPase (P-type)